MEKKIPIDFAVGFSDSKIRSYSVNDTDVTLFLECWNADVLQIRFLNFVSILAMNYFRIADIYEVFESPLLERALNELFEEKPESHNLRIFRFLNSDGMTALEIVSEGIQFERLGS